MAQSNTEKFVSKARVIHGEKYDYSEVEYVKAVLKVTIKCREHGTFDQSPNKHLSGQGCPSCVGKKQTKQNRIEAFRKIHGNRYDYRLISGFRSAAKVSIICGSHGVFKQTVGAHLRGQGCPRCHGRLKPVKEIEIRLRQIYGKQFEFDLIAGQAERVPITVICKKHGPFKKSITKLLLGESCAKCGTERAANVLKKSKASFVTEAQNLHGDLYDYDHVKYKNARTKIRIFCPFHGDFWQSPDVHLRGSGCPSCTEHGFKPDEEASIYILSSDDLAYMKIGIAGNLKTRLQKLRKKTPFKFKLIREFRFSIGLKAYQIEQEAHAKCLSANFSNFDGATEWFLYDPSIIKFVDTAHQIGQNKAINVASKASQNGLSKRSLRQLDFIEKSAKIHKNKYDYTLVNYKNAKTNIKILCPIHGEFEQNPFNHKKGVGCARCSGTRLNNTDVINSFTQVHGDKYDYSLVEYKNAHTKVTINCKIHGAFDQTPTAHKSGSGCPKCSRQK